MASARTTAQSQVHSTLPQHPTMACSLSLLDSSESAQTNAETQSQGPNLPCLDDPLAQPPSAKRMWLLSEPVQQHYHRLPHNSSPLLARNLAHHPQESPLVLPLRLQHDLVCPVQPVIPLRPHLSKTLSPAPSKMALPILLESLGPVACPQRAHLDRSLVQGRALPLSLAQLHAQPPPMPAPPSPRCSRLHHPRYADSNVQLLAKDNSPVAHPVRCPPPLRLLSSRRLRVPAPLCLGGQAPPRTILMTT